MENKISIKEAYSGKPWWYDLRGFLILTFAYRHNLSAQLKLFGNNIKSPHLEVAVGSGTLLDLVLKWRKWQGFPEVQIIAFDYADLMLVSAQKRFSQNKRIELLLANAANLPFENDIFESANIANAIHCLPEVEKSLREIYRVLKIGGTLAGNCLLVPKGNSRLDLIANKINKWGIKKGILHRPYQIFEIVNLLQSNGFIITSEKKVGNCYDFIAKKYKSL